jgi:hypothetical protein
MSYYNTVLAAVCGKTEAIRQFAKQSKAASIIDEEKILENFRLIDITRYQNDCSLYIYHAERCQWNEKEAAAWQAICELAVASQLQWIFYRIGENPDDVRTAFHPGFKATPDHRFLHLFSVERRIRANPYSLGELL